MLPLNALAIMLVKIRQRDKVAVEETVAIVVVLDIERAPQLGAIRSTKQNVQRLLQRRMSMSNVGCVNSSPSGWS